MRAVKVNKVYVPIILCAIILSTIVIIITAYIEKLKQASSMVVDSSWK